MGVGGGVCSRHFQGDEQIELLVGLIIPELGGSDLGLLLEQRHMLVVPCIGNDQTALQGEDAHLLCLLEAVVPMIVVGECRRHILWGLIQALVAFLRLASLALCGILLHLRPQRLVGCSDLARDIAGHLSRQVVGSTEFPIHATLQGLLIAHFAMRVSIARNRIEGIPIGQLRLPQGLELLRGGMQFQFGRHDLFHRTSLPEFTGNVKDEFCEDLRQFLPVLESRGLLGAFVEEFLALLKAHGMEEVVDVRTIPKSRRNPQFGQDMLAAALKKDGIAYAHLAALGGFHILMSVTEQPDTARNFSR